MKKRPSKDEFQAAVDVLEWCEWASAWNLEHGGSPEELFRNRSEKFKFAEVREILENEVSTSSE